MALWRLLALPDPGVTDMQIKHVVFGVIVDVFRSSEP
jgi:hypothetical protein